MVFLRALDITRFSGSPKIRPGLASNAGWRRSTRFLQVNERCGGVWGNYQGPAWDTPFLRTR